MKRISRLGPLVVLHNGQHFELPEQPPRCHGYDRTCHCTTCRHREKRSARVALPWETDYREAA